MSFRLHETVSAVAPIVGVSVPTPGDSSSVVIHFRPEATPAQRSAAEAAVTSFDWSQAAHDQWERGREPDLRDLLDNAQTRLDQIDAYLAIPTPTQAQTATELRRSEIAERWIIRGLVRLVQREWRR